jgi:hypothetical protein
MTPTLCLRTLSKVANLHISGRFETFCIFEERPPLSISAVLGCPAKYPWQHVNYGFSLAGGLLHLAGLFLHQLRMPVAFLDSKVSHKF